VPAWRREIAVFARPAEAERRPRRRGGDPHGAAGAASPRCPARPSPRRRFAPRLEPSAGTTRVGPGSRGAAAPSDPRGRSRASRPRRRDDEEVEGAGVEGVQRLLDDEPVAELEVGLADVRRQGGTDGFQVGRPRHLDRDWAGGGSGRQWHLETHVHERGPAPPLSSQVSAASRTAAVCRARRGPEHALDALRRAAGHEHRRARAAYDGGDTGALSIRASAPRPAGARPRAVATLARLLDHRALGRSRPRHCLDGEGAETGPGALEEGRVAASLSSCSTRRAQSSRHRGAAAPRP